MAYIWINPVTDGMYEPDVLNEFLRHHGYKRFHTSTDWLTIVKEKYRLAAKQAAHTVMDMRCPKTRELLDELGITSEVTIPEINPILIHCGQEGSEREDLWDEEKIITTPCQALADMGNALGLKNTWFVPWNQLLKSIGDKPPGIPPKESPIPPGFFDELGLKTVSITGEKEIRNYFENYVPDEVQLVEMLFCREGCHNGDGIRKCES
ncbi:MAG: hypothetical protein IJ439_07735 [Tyzzerella sp.]|nr:hypothetical protein [Tyzzerella sp.]